MNNLLLSRRRFSQIAATVAGAFALPDLTEAEEPRRKFWFLDQRMTGQREFFHVLGYVSEDIQLPPSQLDDFKGNLVLAGRGWHDFGWEVEQVLSGDRMLYRARVIPEITKIPASGWSPDQLHPDYDSAGPWISPAEAESRYGIVIRRG